MNNTFSDPAIVFQILEPPLLVIAITFAIRSAVVLRQPGLELSTPAVGRGMLALAIGFTIMGVGHLVMQTKDLFGADLFEVLFGATWGRVAWFCALVATWAFSCIGFYYILHATTNARIKRDTKRLREHAFHDPLTGILNRRALEQRANDAISPAVEGAQPLSVLLLDLDHFKRINDTYGHQAGDLVLKTVAAEVQSMLRAGEIFGRFGGEEFFLMLRGGSTQATTIAERIRATIAALAIDTGAAVVEVTGSIGIAMLGVDGSELSELIEAADKALYRAKDRGRNTVVVSTELDA